ncbi:hypothetical protein Tco_0886701, partial [Tanacetum coccineum]
MHTVSPQNTTKGSKPKPRSNNQTSRSLDVSKSSCITITAVLKQITLRILLLFQIPNTLFARLVIRHRFSPNKTSDVYEKTSHRIFKSVSLRWIPTGKLFASCISKDASEPTHGSNVDIPNIHECKQTLDLSAEVPAADIIVMTSMIELESLFDPLFDEYFYGENQVVSNSSAVITADASDKRQQQPDSTSSTSTLAKTATADGNFY